MTTRSLPSRLVESVLATTRYLSIAPGPYERGLPTDVIQGVFTVEQVIELLEGHPQGNLLSVVLAENSPFWPAAWSYPRWSLRQGSKTEASPAGLPCG